VGISVQLEGAKASPSKITWINFVFAGRITLCERHIITAADYQLRMPFSRVGYRNPSSKKHLKILPIIFGSNSVVYTDVVWVP